MRRRFLRRLLTARDGAATLEFAIVGPALIGMMLAVLQIGFAMQNYNALRGIASDVARFAVVNYQTGNRLSTVQLRNYTVSVAVDAPYNLDRDRMSALVVQSANQRVAGATEYNLRIDYRIPTVLGVFGIDEIPISFDRPIFVTD